MCFMALPRRRQFESAPIGGAGFNSYAAGNKSYGLGMRAAPNQGTVQTAQAGIGYGNRDTAAAARRAAIVKRAGL